MDICSTCAASFLLLLLSILSFLLSARAAPLDWKCDSGLSVYAANSTYQSNVSTLLASLASRSSYPPVGFAAAVVGAGADEVWVLGLCRGDTNGTDCRSCLAEAPEVAFGRNYCMGVKDASIFYDRCIVRYSLRDFLTSPDNGQVQTSGIKGDNVTAGAGRFDALVDNLVTALSDWAAFNTTSRFATGVMASNRGYPATNGAAVHNVNGLVQCTPDQAPGPCRKCLQGLIDEMPTFFNGSIGGQIVGIWCYLRFEVFEFYDTSPMLQLVAGQTQPPSPPVSTGQTGICRLSVSKL